MQTRSGFAELNVPGGELRHRPIVSETYWGYVIRPAEPALERAALIEIVATFSGVMLFVAAYGNWLLPGSNYAEELLALKLASTILFALIGTLLIWLGRQGMVQETHVDRAKQELRLVQRNRHGDGRLIGLVPFSEVASVSLRRSKTPFTPSRLCLRMQGDGRFLDLMIANEHHLLPLRDRLFVDMSPRLHAMPSARALRRRRSMA